MTANQIAYWNLQEASRSNQAREMENLRSNMAKEEENFRSNRAREQETYRSNKMQEQLSLQNLDELIRTHLANEAINKKHYDVMDGTSIANSVTGGFKNVTSGIGDLTSGIRDVAKILGLLG